MNISDVSFEEVKEYFKNYSEILEYLNNDERINLVLLINTAIKDIQSCIDGECKRDLGNGDLNFVVLLTLKILYLMVADKFEDIDNFALMWAVLFTNYLKAFSCEYPNEEYLQSIITLLQLKNNMARMIFLSDYIIQNHKPEEYLTVSKMYIDTILEKDLDFSE